MTNQQFAPPPPKPVLASSFMMALHGRKILLHDRPEFGHTITAYILLHQRLERALSTALKQLDVEEERRKSEEYKNPKGNPLWALDAFQDAVYHATELFDFYDKDILCYLRLEKSTSLRAVQDYKSSIAKLKRTWAFICNKCKHNHAFLVPIEGSYNSGEWVAGFSLFRRFGEVVSVEKDLHRSAEVFSYNWAFRSLLADMVKSDEAAAKLINSLQDDDKAPQLKTFINPLPYLHILNKITQRPKTLMPREDSMNLSDIKFIGEEEILITDTKEQNPQVDFKMRIIINLISDNLKVELPYELGHYKLNITGQKLVGAFMRIQIADLIVKRAPLKIPPIPTPL